VQPSGALLALDQDPIEIQRTEERLRKQGFPEETLIVKRQNFAGIRRALDEVGWLDGADAILADLGCSSMQFDDPSRGFSFKHEGPLDMRMNPQRGLPARDLLRRSDAARLAELFQENADEPRAALLAQALSGKDLSTTTQLAAAIRSALPSRVEEDERDSTVRRVFQALRIAVNEEFSVLDTFLRQLPTCLLPGGRVVILTFHSGEDRRVKHAFREGLQAGHYQSINDEVIRPGPQELRDNPRSSPAKLRWAIMNSLPLSPEDAMNP
jgi:16S rRNA (cytosine1402-N4)-methyltransferase